MTGQINVNKIVARSGNLITYDSADVVDITLVKSGGSANTNLKQGLAKVVANITLSGSSNSDAALNVSSVSDGGTGLNTLNITNAFSGAKAAVPNMTNHDDSYNRGTAVDDTGTSAFILRIFQASSGSLSDTQTDQAVTIHGDLA